MCTSKKIMCTYNVYIEKTMYTSLKMGCLQMCTFQCVHRKTMCTYNVYIVNVHNEVVKKKPPAGRLHGVSGERDVLRIAKLLLSWFNFN